MRSENFKFPEKAELNQYWYSDKTIGVIVDEVERCRPSRIAFISTPSLFFKSIQRNLNSYLFEYDSDFETLAAGRFVKFDYHKPEDISNHSQSFDFFVIDPPFISGEVIEAYAKTCRILADPNARVRVMITSISENLYIIRNSFGDAMHPVPFKPSIPNLVYQYTLFINYETETGSGLQKTNPAVIDQA